MLCRSEKSNKVSENGHSIKWIQDHPWVVLGRLFARLGLGLLVLISGYAFAQTTSNLYNPGQAKIDAQLKPWFANIEHVEASSVAVSLLDFRLKIEACEKPIVFDFPFNSHKTVRARCESPSWQYYLQVSTTQSAQTLSPANVSNKVESNAATVSGTTQASQATSIAGSNNGSNNVSNAGAVQSKTAPSPANSVAGVSEPASVPTVDQQLPKIAPQNTLNSGVRMVLTSPQFLKRGTILQSNMFVGTEVASQPGDMSALSNPKDVVNMELLRDLPANTPLKSFDLKPMVMIKRGQQVIVSVGEGRGFLISIRAESLQDGQLGDQIRLKNTESGRSITAVVTGVNTAKAM